MEETDAQQEPLNTTFDMISHSQLDVQTTEHNKRLEGLMEEKRWNECWNTAH